MGAFNLLRSVQSTFAIWVSQVAERENSWVLAWRQHLIILVLVVLGLRSATWHLLKVQRIDAMTYQTALILLHQRHFAYISLLLLLVSVKPTLGVLHLRCCHVR